MDSRLLKLEQVNPNIDSLYLYKQIILYGLSKSLFFDKTIYFETNEYKNELTFMLKEENKDFDLIDYLKEFKKMLIGYRLTPELIFIKLINNVKEYSLNIKPIIKDLKIYIILKPFNNLEYKTKLNFIPEPFKLVYMPLSSNFSMVLADILNLKNLGPNLNLYIYYLQNNIKFNLYHLQERLIDTNFIKREDPFNLEIVKEMLIKRFKEIDYNIAIEDVINFIKDKSQLDIWESSFFIAITDNLDCVIK